jgi:hypothetical protein
VLFLLFLLSPRRPELQPTVYIMMAASRAHLQQMPSHIDSRPHTHPTLLPRGVAAPVVHQPHSIPHSFISQGPPKSLQPSYHSAPPSLQQSPPKSLPSRTHPVPLQTSETSVASLENARYGVGEVPRSEHPNDDRHFMLEDEYCKVYGVFDGHDGPRAAGFASNFFVQYFSSESWKAVISLPLQEQRVQIPMALREFFKAAEKEFFQSIGRYIDERKQLQRIIPQVCITWCTLCYSHFADFGAMLLDSTQFTELCVCVGVCVCVVCGNREGVFVNLNPQGTII